MELKDLKAMAYDLMAQIEVLQVRFKKVNEEIAKRLYEERLNAEVTPEEVVEEKKEEVKEK